jgi:hypothetical protein
MNTKDQKDKNPPFYAGLFFIVLLLISAVATTLEMLLLNDWIVPIQRKTFWGIMTVIFGCIIVFAICIALGWALYTIYFKWKSKCRKHTKNLPETTEKFWSHVPFIPLGTGIITVILLALFQNDYFITIPHGTHKGGMIGAIGSVVITLTVVLFTLSLTLLIKYFKTKKHKT